MRERFPDGWVAAQVHVAGVSWLVARPFALKVHPIATQGGDLNGIFDSRGGYDLFLRHLRDTLLAGMSVRRLPHSGAALEWAHVLPWLTRDQEASFREVLLWRAAASESEARNPVVSDRAAVVRACLGAITDEEGELHRQGLEMERTVSAAAVVVAETELRVDENRRQLATRLGLDPASFPWVDLLEAAIRLAVRTRASSLEAEQARLKQLQADLAVAETALHDATAAAAAAVERRAIAAAEAKARQREAEQLAGAEQERRADELSGLPGRCNVLAAEAKLKRCTAYREASIAMAAHRGRVAVAADASAAAKDAARAEADAQTAAASARSTTTTAEQAERRRTGLRDEAWTLQLRLHRERAEVDELELRVSALDAAVGNANEMRAERAASKATMNNARQRRRTHTGAAERVVEQLAMRFQSVVEALLGSGVHATVELSAEGLLVPRIAGRLEQRGAAMSTVSVVAFDLAALTLGIEGVAAFPGFLVHDGPREADLDLPIYEQLFRHAVSLEKRFVGEPGFQYIVTTTTPPPAEVRDGSRWLVDPPLDASTQEGRLFKVDL